ncbi:MAG: F0F1 ATP synthase subunit B [Planctomycetota bacterium]
MQAMLLAVAAGGEGGFNPLDLAAGGNTLWTLVIFLVAVIFMWKIVMGPVVRALEERDDHAVRAIAAAQKASAEAERARAEVEVALGEAHAEAAKLLAQARERAESRGHEIEEGAKAEAAGMVEAARKAIRAEQDKAISAIRNEVVDLALSAAGKVLEREVKTPDDRRLVAELVTSRTAIRN